MSRALLILTGPDVRERAIHWCRKVPAGTRVEFKAPSRSLEQNARMWAMLTEVSRHVEWHGQKLASEDWKDVFTAALRGYRVVPGINAGTFVPLGMRTSDMTKEEMGDLMELIAAFGAERGVRFHDDTTESPPDALAGSPAGEAGEAQGDTASPADISPADDAGARGPEDDEPSHTARMKGSPPYAAGYRAGLVGVKRVAPKQFVADEVLEWEDGHDVGREAREAASEKEG